MQIFLKSHTHSSSRRGFTLIELLISISIMGVISTMVLLKYSSFDNTVLLKGNAYNIAVAIRDVQVKSLSQIRNGTTTASFRYPFGMSFTPGQKDYYTFKYKDATGTPQYSGSKAENLSTSTLDRTMQVYEVCVTPSGGGIEDCTQKRLDISFRRPEFNALFYSVKSDGSAYSGSIESAKIIVKSTNGGEETFWIIVSGAGQISVKKGS